MGKCGIKRRGGWDPHQAIVCSPGRYLLLAVLQRAYRDATGPDPKLALAAIRWVKNELYYIDEEFPLEFNFVCESLGLDIKKTRALFLGEL